MSNPKPVEGALRDLVARWRSKEFAKLIDLEDSRCTEDICADELEAALSAAPAPTREPYHPENDVNEAWGMVEPKPDVPRINALGALYELASRAYQAGKVSMAPAPARDGVRLELEEVCRVICYCCANPKSGYQPAKLETSGIWEGEWVHRNSAEVDPKMSVHSECSANELRQYVASRAAKEQADGQP